MYKFLLIISFLLCGAVSRATHLSLPDDEPDSLRELSLAADTVSIDSLTAELPWQVRMRQLLATFARECESSYFITGFSVYDLTADSLVFAYNDDKVLRPASTQKLLTTISALDILGASYDIRTRASYTGTIDSLQVNDSTWLAVLHGDIIITGGMDVAYSYGDLVALARDIRALGIDRIDGRLVADISFKDRDLLGSGWCWDDKPSVFHPMLSPLIFDRGKLTPDHDAYPKTLDNYHPAQHFIEVLAAELATLGVLTPDSTRVPIAQAPIYTGASSLAARSSHPFYNNERRLEQFLNRTLKNSDNLYAEAIFAQLCHFNTGAGATAKDGARLIYNIIRKAAEACPDMPYATHNYCDIADGCGLSLYNYHTVQTQMALLRYAYAHDNIYKYLYPSLAIAGRDGSLSSRMKGGTAAQNVHAKTGTLTGVSALSGYCTASNGHTLCFVIIQNGLLRTSTGHSFQDRLCQTITR